MFPIEINGRYKKNLKIINRTVVVGSIVISFFTLPTIWSVTISIVIALIGILIEKTVFVFGIIHINPMPQRLRENQHVSIGYGYNDEDMNQPFICLIFKTKTEAIESYEYFKALAMHNLKDEDNNLILSFVFEDISRYTFYIYPSRHRTAAYSTQNEIENSLEKGDKTNLKVISYIKCFPSTYTGEGNLKEVLKKFTEQVPIEFNTLYKNNGSFVPARKRAIKKYHIRINNRNDLNDKSDVESKFDWYDPLVRRDKDISN